jgi:hypothetical protein
VYVDLPRVRLDGGARHFRRRWGYEPSAPPTLLEDIDEDGDDISDTYSLRDEAYPSYLLPHEGQSRQIFEFGAFFAIWRENFWAWRQNATQITVFVTFQMKWNFLRQGNFPMKWSGNRFWKMWRIGRWMLLIWAVDFFEPPQLVWADDFDQLRPLDGHLMAGPRDISSGPTGCSWPCLMDTFQFSLCVLLLLATKYLVFVWFSEANAFKVDHFGHLNIRSTIFLNENNKSV